MDKLKNISLKNIEEFTRTNVGKTDLLKDSRLLAENNPEMVGQTFYGYYRIIKDLFELSPQDVELIKNVNAEVGGKRGANEFIEVMGKHKKIILDALRQVGNTDLDNNTKGMNDLTEMMDNAWKLKQKEPDWTPKDGDPRADTVIWGFVKGSDNPLINIHFAVCHGIERELTQHLKGQINEDYINHKDWLLSALTDVIALKGIRQEGYEAGVIDMWSKGRPQGLGWISEKRKSKYLQALDTLSNLN